jgi:hypothetical protein
MANAARFHPDQPLERPVRRWPVAPDTYLPGLDDPADAPPLVGTLKDRLLCLGFTEEQIARCLEETEAYARKAPSEPKPPSLFSIPAYAPSRPTLAVTGWKYHLCGLGGRHFWPCPDNRLCVRPMKSPCVQCQKALMASYRAGRARQR